MEHREKPLVIVLSRSYSTGLGVIRALGKEGYKIDLIESVAKDDPESVASKSKYVNRYVQVKSRKIEFEEGNPELISEIMKCSEGYVIKPVLFPADDYTTTIIGMHMKELSKHFHLPHVVNEKPDNRDILKIMDKTYQSEQAVAVGIEIPKEWIIELNEEEIKIPDDMVYPCFVKPIMSSLGYKREMIRCDNGEELLKHLEEMKAKFPARKVLIQEYLEIDREITVLGSAFDQRVIIPAVTEMTSSVVREIGGLQTGVLLPFDMLGEKVCKQIIALVKKMRFVGNFGLDINLVKDKVLFSEVNFRTSGYNYALCKNNVNLPLMFVEYLTGVEPNPKNIELKNPGSTFVYDKLVWEDYVFGHLSKERAEEIISSVNVPLLQDEDDPEPGRFMIEESLRLREERERRKKIRERRESCIESAMEIAGWDREYAIDRIRDARERLGITYNDYRIRKFCLVPESEQKEKYDEILRIRKAKKERTYKKPLVVVLTRVHTTGLSVVRSLGAAGFDIDVVASSRREDAAEIIKNSKYVNNFVEIVSIDDLKTGGDWTLLDELLKYKDSERENIVLFPTDDYSTKVMDLNRDKLKDVFKMPYIVGGESGAIIELMNKKIQTEIAQSAGIAIPSAWTISLWEDIQIPEEITYPCFCKPLQSIKGYKFEISKCEDEEELIEHLRWMKTKNSDRKIMVQEYIEPDFEIDISGVALNQEIIIPAVIRKIDVAEYEKGVTLTGKILKLEEVPELNVIKEKIFDMMGKYHYVGMFDLEFIVSNGEAYFNEVNLRVGRPHYAYLMSGVNLPKLTVMELSGERHRLMDEAIKETGKTFVYEKAAWEDYIHGYLSKRKLNKKLETADVRLLDDKDDQLATEYTKIKLERKFAYYRRRIRRRKIRGMLRKCFGSTRHKILGFPQTKKKNRRENGNGLPRILVAGRNYCSNLTIAKSLGEAGYEVEVLRIFRKRPGKYNILRTMRPEVYSKYVKAYYSVTTGMNHKRIVDRMISLADKEKKMLLLTADDLVAYVIDENFDVLQEYYHMPNINNEAGAIVRMMDKSYQKKFAEEAGFTVLNSCVISSEDPELRIPDSVTYPCFVKPKVSKSSSKMQMRRCDSEEELMETLMERSGSAFELLVEDYVEISTELSLLGLSTPEGVVCPGYFEAIIGGEGRHRGIAMLGKMLPTEEAGSLVDYAIKLMETIKFTGIFDIDFIKTKYGKIYFAELNLRHGGSGYALTRCGYNLPAMFADYVFKGKKLDTKDNKVVCNKTFASDKVIFDAYREGTITYAQAKELMAEADILFIKDKNDMGPYRHMKLHRLRVEKLRRRNIQREIDRQEEEEKAKIEKEKNETN